MRISRPCYDKFGRCPGWNGGGIHNAKVHRCKGGHIRWYKDEKLLRLWKWRFHACDTCNVVVWPYVTRWLDYGWWTWKFQDWRRDWEGYREDRWRRKGVRDE
jgi:hypothetical protein